MLPTRVLELDSTKGTISIVKRGNQGAMLAPSCIPLSQELLCVMLQSAAARHAGSSLLGNSSSREVKRDRRDQEPRMYQAAPSLVLTGASENIGLQLHLFLVYSKARLILKTTEALQMGIGNGPNKGV